ncbi:MAG: L-threonylcarbamoyladenylate synthase, partial [Candidatus Heimdallarchaeota archaeon]
VIATQKKMILPDIVNQKGVAFRISSNKIVQQITKQTQRPLISTSANIAGGKTPYSIEQVFEQLSKKDVDVILDAGTLVKQKPSTIVDFQISPHPQLIRQGEITAEQIFSILRIPKKDWEKHKQMQI